MDQPSLAQFLGLVDPHKKFDRKEVIKVLQPWLDKDFGPVANLFLSEIWRRICESKEPFCNMIGLRMDMDNVMRGLDRHQFRAVLAFGLKVLDLIDELEAIHPETVH